MGLFLVATAFRDVPVADVSEGIQGWYADNFVVSTDATGDDEVSARNRVAVFAPDRGWTVVLWPEYFLHDLEVVEHLSAVLGTVAATANVYDSDCWQHVSFDRGRVVDRFATDPDYLTSDLEPLAVVAPLWKGDPDAVATLFGAKARDVARLYRRNRRARTFDDWGFVDLWAALGITYPRPESAVVALALAEDWDRVLAARR